MRNASDRTMPKKAYAKCVPNETVSHKKLVKEVTEHLRFFPHGMMEAVLEEVFNRLSEHLAQGDRVTLDGLGTFSVSLKCEGAASMGHRTKRFLLVGENGRKTLKTNRFRHGMGNGQNISKRFPFT